jgi:hypothetical protein
MRLLRTFLRKAEHHVIASVDERKGLNIARTSTVDIDDSGRYMCRQQLLVAPGRTLPFA